MKIKSFFAKILIFSLILNMALPAFCEENDTTPKPYNKEEIPQAINDLRRFEIITLGSLPFVTFDVSLAYSTFRYVQHDFDSAYKPDIFSPNTYTQEEQRNIILTSIGICIGIGLTDLFVQLIKRSNKKKAAPRNYDDIAIIPISQDNEASKIPLPESDSEDEASDSENSEVSEEGMEVQEIEE
ncbi:MAG: hypothetical protein J6X84_08895 [Treponema sp.]|nr:hypothetical protein [Treponema sp.]